MVAQCAPKHCSQKGSRVSLKIIRKKLRAQNRRAERLQGQRVKNAPMQENPASHTKNAPVPEAWLLFTQNPGLLSFQQFRESKRHKTEAYVYAWLGSDGLPVYVGSGIKSRATARTRSRLNRVIPEPHCIAVLPCASVAHARAAEAALIRCLPVEWLPLQSYERALLRPGRVRRSKPRSHRQNTRSDAGIARKSPR